MPIWPHIQGKVDEAVWSYGESAHFDGTAWSTGDLIEIEK
jgi:hypothetical protein